MPLDHPAAFCAECAQAVPRNGGFGVDVSLTGQGRRAAQSQRRVPQNGEDPGQSAVQARPLSRPLRHTFATTALEHGMDIKTLSAIIGHVSSATTLDIYSHITDEMQANAANKIEKRFAKNEPFEQSEYETQKQAPSSLESFEPYKGKIRKSGTGGIYELNDHLFEGRYSPTNAYGKREVHTVYANTREECERLLDEMIPKVRAEIKAEKERLKAEQNSLT